VRRPHHDQHGPPRWPRWLTELERIWLTTG
jgi:hypothetical protein